MGLLGDLIKTVSDVMTSGGWDGEHRPSWVNLDRVIRVREGGMRREAAALPREPFERVAGRLQQRYGWH